jgi:hypothetical protein
MRNEACIVTPTIYPLTHRLKCVTTFATVSGSTITNKMTATVLKRNGDKIQVELPYSSWEGHEPYAAGVFIKSIYIGKIAKRCIIRLYSTWGNGKGECKGEYYSLIESQHELEGLAKNFPKVGWQMEKLGMIRTREQTARDNALQDLKLEAATGGSNLSVIVCEFLTAIGHADVANLYADCLLNHK